MDMEPKELQEFIYFITRNKRLSRRQLRLRDSLLVRDFGFTKEDEDHGLNLSSAKSINNDKSSQKDQTIRFHNPHGVISFLSLFSVNDSLKWFTHKWDKTDEPFSIMPMIENAQYNYNKLSEFCFSDSNKGIPASLFYHVWNFINLRNDKSSIITDQFGEQIRTRWADVVEWCKDNPGMWPGAFITPQGQSFEGEINRFKRTIEFRTDVEPSQKFGFQIKRLIKNSINGAVKVEFSTNFDSFGRDAKFYCAVKALHSGIAKLCDWVASYKTKGDTLVVDLKREEGFYILTLLHKGSSMSGSRNKIDGLSGDFKSIREILFSPCDFAITGKFNESPVMITALDKTTQSIGGTIVTPTTIETMTEESEGVCYILKLYQ